MRTVLEGGWKGCRPPRQEIKFRPAADEVQQDVDRCYAASEPVCPRPIPCLKFDGELSVHGWAPLICHRSFAGLAEDSAAVGPPLEILTEERWIDFAARFQTSRVEEFRQLLDVDLPERNVTQRVSDEPPQSGLRPRKR
jgi:hypothetical protein